MTPASNPPILMLQFYNLLRHPPIFSHYVFLFVVPLSSRSEIVFEGGDSLSFIFPFHFFVTVSCVWDVAP